MDEEDALIEEKVDNRVCCRCLRPFEESEEAAAIELKSGWLFGWTYALICLGCKDKQ